MLVSCREQISLGVYITGTIAYLLDQHVLLIFRRLNGLRHSGTGIHLKGLKKHVLLRSFVKSGHIFVLCRKVAILHRWEPITLIHF